MAFLDDDDRRRLVKQYVKMSGMLKDAWIIAGYKGKDGFYAYLRQHPDFHEELKKIKRGSDPTLDAELIEAVNASLRNYALHGNHKVIEDIDPVSGKVISRKVIRSGTPKWVVDKITPELVGTEAALKLVLASLICYLAAETSLADAVKIEFYRVLDTFHRQELISLIQQGKFIKDHDALSE
jgi:hypothetical protein